MVTKNAIKRRPFFYNFFYDDIIIEMATLKSITRYRMFEQSIDKLMFKLQIIGYLCFAKYYKNSSKLNQNVKLSLNLTFYFKILKNYSLLTLKWTRRRPGRSIPSTLYQWKKIRVSISNKFGVMYNKQSIVKIIRIGQ
jgi:hypothetical protein